MSKIQKTIFLIGFFLAAVPALSQSQAAPPNVKEVSARIENGQMTVRWKPVTDATGIKIYRIYFSRQSILGNNGNFDDFEFTSGPDTSFTFDTLLQKQGKVFLAVMAVNMAGVESEGFETEATRDIEPQPQAGSSQTASSVPPVVSGSPPMPMTILSVMPLSSTGLVITFTKPVDPSIEINPAIFRITASGGVTLPVNKVSVKNGYLALDTDPQLSDGNYTLTFSSGIRAKDGTSSPAAGPIPFRGFVDPGKIAPEPVMPSGPPVSQPYGRNPFLPTPDNPVLPGLPIKKPEQSKKPLPASGVGLLGIMVASGLVAGGRGGGGGKE